MMNESNNISIAEDLNSSLSHEEDVNNSEKCDTSLDQNLIRQNDDESSEQTDDDNEVSPQEYDETERYWLESTKTYQMTHDRGELSDTIDDIKPVKGSAEYECYASTRIGGRKENQDTAAFRQTQRGLLLIVCDGMGGGPSGKRASFLAAHVISKYIGQGERDLSDTQLMGDALKIAHNVLKLDMSRYPENYGMGTTAAALLINEHHAVVAHVGDSRIYQIREGRVVFRTIDHSLVARKMQLEGWTDEEARTSEMSNVITQAIGHQEIEPDVEVRPYLKGDRFLICSDGIWGHYPQKQLLRIICGTRNLGGALSDLMVTTDNIGIDEGNRHDNFTAILVQTNISSKLKDTMTKLTRLSICVLGILLAVSVAFNIIQYKRSENRPVESVEKVEEKSVPVTTVQPYVSDGASAQQSPSEDPVMIKNDTLYVVKKGDIIGKIAKQFNVSTDQIKKANPDIDLHRISIGQVIVIPLNNSHK